MAEPKNPLAATGRTVAANVRRLRGQLGYAELSRRLAAVGRPIPVLGLSHIEKERRRVDADDLVALSLALDVTPIALLMPDTEKADDPASVTGALEATEAEVTWLWLRAERPLDLRITRTATSVEADGRQWKEFLAQAQPRWKSRIGTHFAEEALTRAEHSVAVALTTQNESWMAPMSIREHRQGLAKDIRAQAAELLRFADDLEVGRVETRDPWWTRGDG